MVGRCMPNSGHGGPPGTQVITIFVFYVSAQIPNIEYFEVYGGRYLIFFLVKFPVDCRQNHVWGPIFVPSYDHLYKNTLLQTQTHTHMRAVVAVVVAVAVAAVVVAAASASCERDIRRGP